MCSPDSVLICSLPLSAWKPEDWDRLRDMLTIIRVTKGACADLSDMLVEYADYVDKRDAHEFSINQHKSLDEACMVLLSAAFTIRSTGWILLAMNSLSDATKTRLQQYDPMLRPRVWELIDNLLGYPFMNADGKPSSAGNRYNPARRMLSLLQMIRSSSEDTELAPVRKPRKSKARADDSGGSGSGGGSSESTAQPKTNTCCNCGKHCRQQPDAWTKYDAALQLVWCQTCYMPELITASRATELYDIKKEALASLPSVSLSGPKRDSSTYYLFEQVMKSLDAGARTNLVNSRIVASKRRPPCEDNEGGDSARRALAPPEGSDSPSGTPVRLRLRRDGTDPPHAAADDDESARVPVAMPDYMRGIPY